jgi:biopolymer transport protein ExbD
MGAAIGADDKKSVNVELNIVPFIDLMSCLTAFLLVTAVWVNIAQINIQPKGKSRDSQVRENDEELVQLSVLVQADKIWLGLSRINEFQSIDKTADGQHNWEELEIKLREQKSSTYFADRTNIEIAGESTDNSQVSYQDIVSAMDRAIKAGFIDVGLSDPAGLAARPQL